MMYEKIFDILTENNIAAYPPGIHEGECTSEYVVVKNMGKSKYADISSQYALIDIICHVPQKRPVDLIGLTERVKVVMKGLYPEVLPTGTETPDFNDDSAKSVTSSIEYRYNIRM